MNGPDGQSITQNEPSSFQKFKVRSTQYLHPGQAKVVK